MSVDTEEAKTDIISENTSEGVNNEKEVSENSKVNDKIEDVNNNKVIEDKKDAKIEDTIDTTHKYTKAENTENKKDEIPVDTKKTDINSSSTIAEINTRKCTHCDFKATDNIKLQSHFQDMHLDDFVEQTIMQTLKENMPKTLLNSNNEDELQLLKEKATKSFIGDIKGNNSSKQTEKLSSEGITKDEQKEFPIKSGLEPHVKKKPGRPKGYSPKLAAAGLPQTKLVKEEDEEVAESQKAAKEEIQNKPKMLNREEIKDNNDGPEQKRIRADRSKGTCVQLPNGWKRQTWLRKNGVMAGKFDVCVWNKDGEKFRSKIGLEKYCKDNNITDIDINQYFTPDQEFFQENNIQHSKQVSITDYFKTKFDESNETPENSNDNTPTNRKMESNDSDKHKRQKLLLQNLTPLGLWSARKKKAIMAKHPEWSLSQVARLIAAAWKKVGDDEVERLKAEISAMNGSLQASKTINEPKNLPILSQTQEKPKPRTEVNNEAGFKCKHCDHKASSAVKLDTHTIVMH